MKKFFLASLAAMAGLSLVFAPPLRAQDSITIKDPAEFNTYQSAITQSDPKIKASSLESFLVSYPQSVVKKAVLDLLLDTYSALGDNDKTLSAASRLLQVDPNNAKAVFISVYIKKSQCQKTSDPQTCDDAAVLAQKGLAIPKEPAVADADWKNQTAATYPIYHSAIALDDAVSKKDLKAAVAEYRTELMLYSADQTTKGPGLADTLNLAELYVKPEARDLIQAIWFYARAWNFAPAAYKGQIEPKLEYYYKKYHGGLDGLDDVKAQAAATVFPPATFVIAPAPTPADIAHKVVAETPDLSKLNLSDKEFILASGSKEDADKLWAVMKDQTTPVPGTVLEATDSVIKLAVTQDAKDAKIADFIVNLKKPLTEKEIPAVGFEYKIQPAAELDATYDTYTQIPATATLAQTAEIVLRDGFIQPEKKKTPAHKPAAGHRPAAH
ncbi:MAG: hypothetical protein ABR956_15950 [Terracidiphilus sp.]|jgi:hypothetical protein